MQPSLLGLLPFLHRCLLLDKPYACVGVSLLRNALKAHLFNGRSKTELLLFNAHNTLGNRNFAKPFNMMSGATALGILLRT